MKHVVLVLLHRFFRWGERRVRISLHGEPRPLRGGRGS
jgi:hypothetical protein